MRCPVYHAPASAPVQLTREPRLASWDAAGHPSQAALAQFLERAQHDLQKRTDAASPPWALQLDVAIPATARLLDHHDLDNYLYPLIQRLGGSRVVSARAIKRHGDRSQARLDTARRAEAPADRPIHRVRTTASAGSIAYKQQIHDRLTAAGARPVPNGSALSAVIGFRCGPSRNWFNLWKPTIDALGALLGEGDRMWNPRDGAIVDLALHLLVDSNLRWDVDVFIGVCPAEARTPVR